MVGACSLRFSRKLDNILTGLSLRFEGAGYHCINCEETTLSSHLLVTVCGNSGQIPAFADGATTK